MFPCGRSILLLHVSIKRGALRHINGLHGDVVPQGAALMVLDGSCSAYVLIVLVNQQKKQTACGIVVSFCCRTAGLNNDSP